MVIYDNLNGAIIINDGVPTTGAIGNMAHGGLNIGVRSSGGNWGDPRFYGHFMGYSSIPTADELTQLDEFLQAA